ncbi:endosialidase-like protein [Falsochrobactrum ovis]|uniref:Endosialidase-like protein n=3 Tax=Falsochrobactrum ovis TaxID=1293442 RepID=A0A364JRR9_9HYPH|nr:endosialidase-like protein [Falsochrobactrum ovis]
MRTFGGKNGNIVAMLMGTVAMVGIVGVSAMNMIGGPITTAAKVTHQNMAQNDLLMNAKVVVMNASTRPQMGDEDGDGYIEPVPFVPASDSVCGITLPTGGEGGCLPADIGAILTDPWGSQYAYCVWDHGDPASSANRIDGEDSTSGAVLAIISAGPNKRFETPCLPYDGDPETNDIAIDPRGVGDDLVQIYTYAAAVAGSGGLWELKDGEPTTAVIDKKLEIGDVAGGTGFAFDTGTGTGEFPYVKADYLASKSGGGTPVEFMDNIALAGKWLSGDGQDEGLYVDANGNVGIAAGKTYQIDGQDFLGVGGQEDSTVLGLGAVAHRGSSTVVGFRAGSAATTGGGLSFFGVSAGGDTTGNLNAISAFGVEAGRYNKGSTQSAFGARAGYENEGNSQSAFGNNAGRRNTGDNQSVFGSGAGTDNTTLGQSAFGVNAGKNNTGSHQSVFGYTAGSNNTGDYQVAFGRQAGNTNSGSFQTAIGYIAGSQNTGNFLTALGAHAGRNNTGHNVVAIGYGAGRDNTLANQFIVQQSNVRAIPLIQGNFATGRVGIGRSDPANTLHVAGVVRTDDRFISRPPIDKNAQDRAMFFGIFPDSVNTANGWDAGDIALGLGGGANSGTNTLRILGDQSRRLNVQVFNGDLSVRLGKVNAPQYCDQTGANCITSAGLGNLSDIGDLSCSAGQIIKWHSSDGWVCAGDNSGGGNDDLGNHTATQNLRLNGNWLSGDGGNEGVFVASNGRVGIGITEPADYLHVKAKGLINGKTPVGLTVEAEGALSPTITWYRTHSSGARYWRARTASWTWLLEAITDDKTVATQAIEIKRQPASSAITYVSFPNGNVGIGTNNPTHKMHLEASNTTSAGLAEGVRVTDPSESTSAILRTGGGLSLIRPGTATTSPNTNGFIDFSAYPDLYPDGRYARLSWNDSNDTLHLTARSDSATPVNANLTLSGGVNAGGPITAAAYYHSSDRNLKTDIERISDPFALLDGIEGKRFVWKDSRKPAYGVIAQDVEAVMPDAIGINGEGFKTVEYDQLVAPLIEAVKQLKADNDDLAEAVRTLQADNDNLRHEIRALTKEAR